MKIKKELVQQFFLKDEKAVYDIYNYYFRLIKSIALDILRDDSYADDIVQETFLKALDSKDTYHEEDSFSSWLCTIAKNLSLNKRKDLLHYTVFDMNENKPVLIEKENHKDVLYESKLLNQIRSLLNEEEYHIFILRAYYDFSFVEIAELKNEKSVSKVRSQYHRLLKKLKHQIKM